MSSNNKHSFNPQFLKKPLSMSIKMASGVSLMIGAMGVATPVFAQAQKADNAVEEVIVTGQRASVQSAQELKKNSSVIVDSIVAEDIGKLPDRSVTEALQRVPGVSIGRYTGNDPEHPAVEGSGVAIRGLTQVRAELNGRDVFSAKGGRGLSFEDVPSELMYAVDTYKSPSADMIEGGLGGTVNLRTRMPFDSEKQLIGLSAKANYGDQLEETNGEYSGLYSNRWETSVGEFGVLVNASTSDLSSRSDQVYSRAFLPRNINGDDVWVSKGVDWRRNDYESTREGGYLALQWAPNDDTELYFTAFQSKHDSVYDENAFFLEGGNGDQALVPTSSNDWVYNENDVMVSGTTTVNNPAQWGLDFGTSTRWANNVSKTTDYSTGIKWSPDDHWKFSADLQYINAEATADDYTLGLKVIPSVAELGGVGTKNPSILIDPSFMSDYRNYSLGQQMTHFERNDAEAKTGRFDAEYDFDGDVIKSVKVGMRYSEKTADNIDTGYDWNTRYATWFGGYDKNTLPKVTDAQAAEYLNLYSFDDFQRGDIAVPAAGYLYSSAAVQNFRATTDAINSNCGADGVSAGTCKDAVYMDWTRLDNEDYRNLQEETKVALYMMANYAFEDLAMPIDGNVGVRVVQTDNVASGAFIVNQVATPDGVVIIPQSSTPYDAVNNYTDVLPSFNLKMAATDDIFVRFAASKAIWAPSFSDMIARTVLSGSRSNEGVVTFSLDQDTNPYLEPMKANQFDLSAEWYFDESGGMAHAALFHKQVKDYFRKGKESFTVSPGNGQTFSGTASWLGNYGKSDITGVEVGVSKFFDTLPGLWSGFGVQANYTYIDSEMKVPPVAAPTDTDKSTYGTLPAEQLSKNSYNLIGMYEKDGWSARLAYSWRSQYLVGTGPNGFNPDYVDWSGKAAIPVYNDDYGQLDASISYTFLENYTVTADATNLLQEKTVGIMDQNESGDNVGYTYAQDARFSLGIRAKF